MNNHHKLISLHSGSNPLKKGGGDFFQKKLFMADKLFWAKYLWGGYSKWKD